MSETKDYIIDRAFELFMSRSYEAVSINDISQAIGLTKGALYHHFTNKEELFKAVVNKHFDMKCFEIKEIPDSLIEFNEICLDKAKQTIERIASQTKGFSVIDYMSFITDSFRHYPGFAESNVDFISNETNKIKQVLDKAIECGEIRPDINTTLFSQTYISYMFCLAMPIIKQQPIEEAIGYLRSQIMELYKLIKL
jgi:Transcriptional regulator